MMIALKEPPRVRLKTDHQMWALDQSLEASKETVKVLKPSAAVLGKKKHVFSIVTMISGGKKNNQRTFRGTFGKNILELKILILGPDFV